MCGVIGIVGNDPVVSQIAIGLYDLQHRGEQAFGIATSDGTDIYSYTRKGLVAEAFSEDRKTKAPVEKLRGNLGIGHTLYSTIGLSGEEKQAKSIQPLSGNFHGEKFALAHNGNLINLEPLRKEAEDSGYRFDSRASDTEVIVALLSTSEKTDFLEALVSILPRLQGAFSLVILLKDKVIGVRDGNGIRPLCLGRIGNSSHVIASEDCALHTLNGSFIREFRPGELIVISDHGIEKAFIWAESPRLKLCIFEFVYFARPDSSMGGQRIYWYREKAGQAVAQEHPVKYADLVSSVPESGTIYNYGVSQALGIPVRRAISRNRYYAKRTFLMPREINRRSLQESKFYILRELVANKVVIITEDSIFRGNVSPVVVGMLRKMGVNEVHLLVGSAPICYPCFLGIDIPSQEELIAANNTMDEIKKQLCVDSLGYLSIEGMVQSSGLAESDLCMGCFTGKYPVDPPENLVIKRPSCK